MALVVLVGACAPEPATGEAREPSLCRLCHGGLEPASPTHERCVSCHGGDPLSMVARTAHAGLRGGANPAAPAVWEDGCGQCHPDKIGRVAAGLMNTNVGMIKNIRLTWDDVDADDRPVAGEKLYASSQLATFNAAGEPVKLAPVAELGNMSGELYRKFCAACHVGRPSTGVYFASHAAGCAACHFPFAEDTVYRGGDATIRGTWPRAATHRMAALPPNEACARCHNRSGRIALSYQGLDDGNDGLVPTRGGRPGPRLIGGARTATAIAPDVHHAAGLECIDCHTSREVMGDGYAYQNLYEQTEIRCEDCHGGPRERPRAATVGAENAAPLRESRSYARPVRLGERVALTSKGRPYSNVFIQGEQVVLRGKRSGKAHVSKVITETPAHTIWGHERLECIACHSRTVAQCFGCHTRYDRRESMPDLIRGGTTPGAFSETEDVRNLYPFPLAVTQRGTIGPVTPGCQTLVTVVEADGRRSRDEYVTRYKGAHQFRFAPFYGHNTGTRAVSCAECHGNPAFVGFGQNVVDDAGPHPTLRPPCGRDRPLDGFLVMEGGRVVKTAAITRDGGRPLTPAELGRFFAVNLCLGCHEDANDPIYQSPLDYDRLDSCLRRAGVEPGPDPAR